MGGFAKKILILIGTLIALVAIFSILMIFQALIPDAWVEHNVVRSVEILDQESGSVTNEISLSGYTEQIMLKNSITGNNQFYSSSESYNDVQEAFWNHGVETRYWQGYLSFLKPLLVFFDLVMIRNIGSLLFLGLMCITLLLLAKKSNQLSLAFLIAVSLVSPYIMVTAISFVPVFLIMLLATITLVLMTDKKKDSLFNIAFLFLIVGACTTFFDFLTTPIITLGAPVLAYLAYKYRGSPIDIKHIILIVVLSCLLWGMSYVFIWASKWILATLITGHNVLGDALNQLVYRSGVSTVDSELGLSFTRTKAVEKNLDYFPYLTGLSIVAAIGALITVAVSRSKPATLILLIAIIFMSITPILWMLVTANHVFVHALFTHRGILVYLLGCCILISFALTSLNDLRITKKSAKAV